MTGSVHRAEVKSRNRELNLPFKEHADGEARPGARWIEVGDYCTV